MRALLLIPLFFLFTVCEVLPQPVRYLGIEHGLSNNTVNVIYKDSFGFMWFGTDDGLNQYDGYSFKVFRNRINDTTSLIHNQINRLAEDGSGTIWVATRRGLCAFNNFEASFRQAWYYPYQQKVKKMVSVDVVDLKVDRHNNVLAAAAGLGLLRYDQQAGAFRQVPLQTAPGLVTTSYHATTLQPDNLGKTWVMVNKVGLCFFDAQRNKLVLVSDKVKCANIIQADQKQQLWLGSENGLFRYNIHANTFEDFGKGRLSAKRVLGLSLEAGEKLWVATDGGGISILNLRTDETSYILYDPDIKSITSNAVSSLYKDQEGRWWIGTFRGGINIIDEQQSKFKTIVHNQHNKNSLVNNFAFSFCEDYDGSVWIGTDGGGLSVWDRQANTFKSFAHQPGNPASLSHNTVTSIIRDHRNNIWIATYGGGINKYNRETGTFEHYTCNDDNDVWRLFEGRDHTIWAGTCSGGTVYRLNRNAARFEVFDSTLTDVITFAEDRSGTLWMGTFYQLIKVDKQKKQHVYSNLNHPVRAIKEDRNENFWIGTQGLGLLRYDRSSKQYTGYTESEGLANNSVLNIEEDQAGNLWISTYHGVSRFNPITEQFRNFYETDGLQSNQFNYNASLRLSSNELLLGGIKGFNVFHPDSVWSQHAFPNLVFTGIRLFNRPVTATDNIADAGQSLYFIDDITLPYDKAFISFDFGALEFTAPGKITYAYMLEGWDKMWNYTRNQRSASYSNLREGNYTLRIRSTNSEGLWNEQERTVRIRVLPPWYRSWWAFGVYAALICGLVYVYNYYRTKQDRLRYELEIARIKAEKEAELNEKKLSFFTNVSHEFRTPLTLIINPLKELVDKKQEHIACHDVAVVYRNARRLLGLVDQLLLFRKADSGEDNLKVAKLNLAAICEEVYQSFTHQARIQNLHYSFKCDNYNMEYYGDREKLDVLLFNLLSNAFKFTPTSGQICLQVTEHTHQVEIKIIDSGCGIPADTGNKLFNRFQQVHNSGKAGSGGFGIGLYLVKKFVEQHRGEISYESELQKGTTFKILLPKGMRHLPAESIYDFATKPTAFLKELLEALPDEQVTAGPDNRPEIELEELVMERHSLLLVEDNVEVRQYVKKIFSSTYLIYEAENGEEGLALAQEYLPDVIISDLMMPGMSGLELCSRIKENASLNHIPIILLTATSSQAVKLLGIEGGAVDYITKPFEKELLVARVESILRSRDNLQRYFYNEVTLKTNKHIISSEYSNFLAACIETIERNIENTDFNVKVFAREMGMSHSSLYKRVKDISGRSVSDFVRFIRLRKVALMLIGSDCKINEAAAEAGFNDMKHFREQFNKLFGLKPSDYVKKYRKSFNKSYALNGKMLKEAVYD